MADKTTKTIRIKWVRSGIGFPRRHKTWIKSLGLRELNQVVERPDTPQIRGLVARAHRLVEIVGDAPARVLSSQPEYTVWPPEVAPAQAGEDAEKVPEEAAAEAEVTPLTSGEPGSAEGKEEAVEAAESSGRAKSKKAAATAAAAKKTKPAKDAARKAKKPGKPTASKGAHASKARKK